MKNTLFLLGLAMLIAVSGCKKDKPEGRSLTCSITSPKNGEELSVYDDLIITIDAKDSNGSITAVMVYLDSLPCGTAMTAPYIVAISSEYLSLGSHKLKAVAVNDVATQKESATITIAIIDDGGGGKDESPDFVTFANGEIPLSWRTSSWEVDVAMGYDDGYSLKSKEYPASVLTNKTMKAPGYIEFYTRGNNFDLYIDRNKKKALSSTPNGNWTKWIYDVGQGKHEFLWETTLGASVYLDAIKFTIRDFLLLGDEYQGGIVAYVDETGKHGLIAAPKDQAAKIQWYNGSYIKTDATGTAYNTGKSNTEKIVQTQGAGNYAAKLCDDLILNGYDDWFLPGKDELNELYKNKGLIGGFSNDGYYWSSSESDNNTAWLQSFSNGNQVSWNKKDVVKVRAVREF
jgi:hypothetical protein